MQGSLWTLFVFNNYSCLTINCCSLFEIGLICTNCWSPNLIFVRGRFIIRGVIFKKSHPVIGHPAGIPLNQSHPHQKCTQPLNCRLLISASAVINAEYHPLVILTNSPAQCENATNLMSCLPYPGDGIAFCQLKTPNSDHHGLLFWYCVFRIIFQNSIDLNQRLQADRNHITSERI